MVCVTLFGAGADIQRVCAISNHSHPYSKTIETLHFSRKMSVCNENGYTYHTYRIIKSYINISYVCIPFDIKQDSLCLLFADSAISKWHHKIRRVSFPFSSLLLSLPLSFSSPLFSFSSPLSPPLLLFSFSSPSLLLSPPLSFCFCLKENVSVYKG